MKRGMVAWACALCGLTSLSQAKVTLTDLGTLGGTDIGAYGINDSGQVVGGSTIMGNNHPTHAFLYSNGKMTDLGTLGGTNSYALGINNAGQIVGYSDPMGDQSHHAFTYKNGKMTDLGTLPGGNNSLAYGVNASGQIVGESDTTASGDPHAFLYSAGKMTDLGTLGGKNSSAYGINDAGQIVGDSSLSGETKSHAFLYNEGHMIDLGTLGGAISIAKGINASGQIVGNSNLTGDRPATHAFLYSNNHMSDLGVLPECITSNADGINKSGQVLGSCTNDLIPNLPDPIVLYGYGIFISNVRDVLPPIAGWTLGGVTAINDSGLIVCGAFNPMGTETHFFLIDLGDTVLSKTSILKGDLDNIERIDVGDATIALEIVVGLKSPVPAYLLALADVAPKRTDGTYGDGIVQMNDVMRILRRALGLEPDPWP